VSTTGPMAVGSHLRRAGDQGTHEAFRNLATMLLPQSAVEWVWWPLLGLWSFLPATLTPVFSVGGLLISLTDLTLAGYAVIGLPVTLFYRKRYHRVFLWTVIPFTLLACYAILSAILTGGVRRYDFSYIIFPPLEGWFAMVVGFQVVSSLPQGKLRGFTLRLVVAVAAITSAYAYVTFFPPERFRVTEVADPIFGLPRISGPLGVATMLPAALLPAISFVVCGLGRATRTILGIALAFLLTGAILLTGSRSALLALLSFAAVVLIRHMPLKRKVALVFAFGLAGAAVFKYANIDRMIDFTERIREESYLTSIRAWTDSYSSVFFGQGYGQIWPWYERHVYVFMGQEESWAHFFATTNFGRVVTSHGHSTYLPLVAELGVLGLCLLALALGSQIRDSLRFSSELTLAWLLVPGVLASLIILAFDSLLFKGFQLSAIWWAFFFLMAADLSAQLNSKVSPNWRDMRP
jgi:O-antigen ligase